jgi:N-acetylmuramic acid 6-phosphate etherase
VYEDLPTERIDENGPDLDLLSPADIARLLWNEERRALDALHVSLDAIESACEAAARALRSQGRLIYAGAGTSGRLGVLDASEMDPTFGAPPGQVVALLAGAPDALTRAVEGAEDDAGAGARAAEDLRLGAHDCVVGITMSGTAAYVAAVLEVAKRAGAQRILLTANRDAATDADIRIVIALGPELLAGSTRLKGGSATKAVLNMISTAAMAASGAVYQNLMVRVRPTNRKLRDRAERLVARLAGVDAAEAPDLLARSGDAVPIAVLMARRSLERVEAERVLLSCGGSLRRALE